jgi:hypothetical protein
MNLPDTPLRRKAILPEYSIVIHVLRMTAEHFGVPSRVYAQYSSWVVWAVELPRKEDWAQRRPLGSHVSTMRQLSIIFLLFSGCVVHYDHVRADDRGKI